MADIDNESKQSSDLFTKYSQSLDRSADALRDAAKAYKETENDLNKLLTSSLSKLDKMLSQVVKDYEKINDQDADNSEKTTKDISKIYDRNADNINAGVTKFKAAGTGLINTFQIAGKFIINKFTSAFETVVNNYNSELSSITTRMQMSNAQYTKMLNKATDYFVNKGLNIQWSEVDFTAALESVLDTGLRNINGMDSTDPRSVEQRAYRNLISNKLIPSINTNTRQYIKMSKSFGEAFDKNTVALAKYTESIYGAEAIDEGKFDSMLTTLQSTITLAAQGNADLANQMITSLQGTTAWLEANNIDSTEIIDALYSAVTSSTGEISNLMLLNSGISTQQDALEVLRDPTKFRNFIQNYLGSYTALGSGVGDVNSMITYANVMGGSAEQALQINAVAAAGKISSFGSDFDKFVENYDANAEYQKQIDRLAKGDYQSITDQQNKFNENLVAKAANEVAEIIPDPIGTLSGILELIKVWFGVWTTTSAASKLAGAGEKGANLISKLTGGSAKTLAGIGKGTSLLPGASSGGALGYMSGAAGIGGLIWSAIDANTSMQAARVGGANIGEVALQGLRGAITGGSYMSAQEENDAINNALMGNKRNIDLGQAFKNAGKGALLGAGASSVIGPLGTVAGTVGGAIIGGVANVIDQLVENAKFNNLADAVNEFNDSLEATQSSISKFKSIIQEENSLQSKANSLLYDSNVSEQEKLSILQELKEKYPTLLLNVKDLSDFDEDYVKIIQDKIAREKELAATQAITDLGSLFEGGLEASEATHDLIGDKVIGENVMNFIKEFENEDAAFSMDKDKFNELIRKHASEGGMSVEQFVDLANEATNGGFFAKDYSGPGGTWTGKYSAKQGTWGDNYLEALESYDDRGYLKGADTTSLLSAHNEDLKRIQNIINQVDDIYGAVVGEDKNGNKVIQNLTENQKSLIQGYLETLPGLMNSYNYNASILEGTQSQFHSTDSRFANMKELSSLLGYTFPQFKVGLYEAPYDMLAGIHQGESVLTSTQSRYLHTAARNANLGVGEYLSLLSALSSSSGASVGSEKVLEYLTNIKQSGSTPVEDQTNVLSQSLSNIADLIVVLIQKLSAQSSQPVISSSLITHMGGM